MVHNNTEKSEREYSFALVDYLVFGTALCVYLGVGIYYAVTGGRRQTTTDYLVGNRRLRMLPVALSLVVSFQSSIFMLGFPAEIYVYGASIFLSQISLVASMFIGGAWIAVQLIHPLKITSFYEYMELRYDSRGPRLLCTVIGMLYFLFYMGIVLNGPALALQAVMQFPLSQSILIVAVTSVTCTALGGIRAVVLTNVLQFIIMSAGLIAITTKASVLSGGFDKVWEINKMYKRLDVFDFRTDPTIRHTTWSLLFGNFASYLALVFNQASIQRIGSVSTIQEARKMFLISGLIFFATAIGICLEGLSTFAYYNTIRCDPLVANQISNANQVVPYMVIRIFNHLPGMSGLFMTALFSATLSMVSSGLSSLSAQFTEDIVKPHFRGVSDVKATVVAKFSVLAFGILATGISFIIANVKGSLFQIGVSLSACFSGPLTGIFLYSVFCPWATKQGAVIGGIIGMAFTLWLSFGQMFSTTIVKQPWLPHNPVDQCSVRNDSIFIDLETNIPSLTNYDEVIEGYWNWNPNGMDKLYAISYHWLSTLAILTVIVTGSIVSFVTGYTKSTEVDVRYILSLGETVFPYLPKRAQKFLEFGVPFEKRREWLKQLSNNGEMILIPNDVTMPVERMRGRPVCD